MTEEDRQRLAEVLASLDDTALVALGNRGLLRRATKDLVDLELRVEEIDEGVLVHAADWTVTMPPTGPQDATDSTRATGVTRQILTATMHLRDVWAVRSLGESVAVEMESEESSLATLDSLEVRTLRRWAGADAFGRAQALLRTEPEVEIEGSSTCLAIRFPNHEVEVRLLGGVATRRSGALLDAFLSTAPRAAHRTWVVAAILLVQRDRGLDPQLEVVPAEKPGTTLDGLDAVLSESAQTLRSMVAAGLAHPSERWSVRLAGLAPAASAASLPRFDRVLRAVAQEVDLALERHVHADARRLLDRVSTAWALLQALKKAADREDGGIPLDLAGRHRTRYLPCGDLDLVGLGAVPWSTASGYAGFTVHFWDLVGGRFLSWSHARPRSLGGEDLRQVFSSEIVWSGAGPAAVFSRQRLSLEEARLNHEGRLSASQSTRARIGEASLARDLRDGLRSAGRWLDSWDDLRGLAREQVPSGLSPTIGPMERLVVLSPARWGDRRFDELQQRFLWDLEDSAGEVVCLSLPWTTTHEDEIAFLESISQRREKLDGVLVRLTLRQEVELRPLALLASEAPEGRQVLSPGFDAALLDRPTSDLLRRLRKKFGRDRIRGSLEADDPDALVVEEDEETDAATPPAIALRLEEARRQIERRAETGTSRADTTASDEGLSRTVAELDRAGLGSLARRMERIPRSPENLLDAAWACRLHRQVARRLGG